MTRHEHLASVHPLYRGDYSTHLQGEKIETVCDLLRSHSQEVQLACYLCLYSRGLFS